MLSEIGSLFSGQEIVRLAVISLLMVLSSVIGASACGVEKGYYGKSRYLFKLKKNFADTIVESDKKLYIYVQVVELTPDGIERRRPDLTRNVEIYSRDNFIEIGYTLMNGYHAESSLKLKGELVDESTSKTDIIVSYRGKEGVFKNSIEFKV